MTKTCLIGCRVSRRAILYYVPLLVFGSFISRPAVAGLTFDLRPAAGTPQEAADGFEEAARLWSALLEDDVTVRLNVRFANIAEPNVLGFAVATEFTSTYNNVRSALAGDELSPDDMSTVSHLQPGGNFSMLINYTSNNPNGAGSDVPYVDSFGLNTSTVRLTRANAKALGLVTAASGVSDGTITFDEDADWDFDRSDGISFGMTDYVGAAAHEIGHAMGFRSGVDILDNNSPGPGGTFSSDNTYRDVTAADLFRFSTDSVAEGTGVIDWTAGREDKYFSVDGGINKLVSFATGSVHGDRRQASHWKDNRRIGLMEPTISPREFGAISENDIRMFDVIGWDRNFFKTWNAAGGNGRFHDIESWIGGVPGEGHTALFGLPDVYSVTFNAADAQSGRLVVTGGEVNLNLGGATYTQTDPLLSTVVGDAFGQIAGLAVRSGTLAGTSAAIARVPGSNGHVTVTGSSASWTLTEALYVGGEESSAGGTGLLVARTSALVSVDQTLKVWESGTVLLDGGFVEALRIEVAGLLTGAGQISGPGELSTTLINRGRIEPGAALGTIEVDGDFIQHPDGGLVFELAGLTPGAQFDRLDIFGTATLDGLLKVTLTDGFAPRAGDRFGLVTFAERGGMFESVSLPELTDGLAWSLEYGAGQFAIMAIGPLLGDTDADGDVDIDDLNSVRNNFGEIGMPVTGDTDADGDVDIDDLNNVRNNFGAIGAVSVPEPGAMWLFVLAVTIACGVPRGRRR